MYTWVADTWAAKSVPWIHSVNWSPILVIRFPKMAPFHMNNVPDVSPRLEWASEFLTRRLAGPYGIEARAVSIESISCDPRNAREYFGTYRTVIILGYRSDSYIGIVVWGETPDLDVTHVLLYYSNFRRHMSMKHGDQARRAVLQRKR